MRLPGFVQRVGSIDMHVDHTLLMQLEQFACGLLEFGTLRNVVEERRTSQEQ